MTTDLGTAIEFLFDRIPAGDIVCWNASKAPKGFDHIMFIHETNGRMDAEAIKRQCTKLGFVAECGVPKYGDTYIIQLGTCVFCAYVSAVNMDKSSHLTLVSDWRYSNFDVTINLDRNTVILNVFGDRASVNPILSECPMVADLKARNQELLKTLSFKSEAQHYGPVVDAALNELRVNMRKLNRLL